MSDKIGVIQCQGGLNEEASELNIGSGYVRRSSNYEQVAEGGYRRIAGSVKFGGSEIKPDMMRVTVIETTKRFDLNAGGQKVLDDGGISTISSLSSASKVLHRILAAVGRDNSELQIVEKDQVTQFFDTGEIADAFHPAVLLAENPELTEAEEDQIIDILSNYGLDLEVKPEGSRDVELLQSYNGNLLCARRDNTFGGVIFQTSGTGADIGTWNTKATLNVPPSSSQSWQSVEYQFAGKLLAVFITTGESQMIVADATVRFVPVPSVSLPPTHVIVHQNHLFLGFENGAVIHSDIGDPESFTGVGGAAEFNVGSRITGFQVLKGASLAIFSENKISILTGTSTADWVLTTHTNQSGAVEGSIQNLPTTIFASQRGITTLSASDTYGDFADNTLSHLFNPTYQKIIRGSRIYSLTNREKSQYRIFNENGIGLYLTFSNNSLVGAMEIDLKHRITAVATIQGDVDKHYYASDDGVVHRMDMGSTMSGRAMDAFLEFPFNHYKSPRQKKRFKQSVLDMQGDPRVQLEITSVIDKGQPFHCEPEPVDVETDPRLTRYKSNELSRFDQSFEGNVYTVGTGHDQSLLIRAMNEADHEIDAIKTHFTYRGQQR